MVLSILIPVYNYDCSGLVRTLHKQAAEAHIPCQILVAEDGSTNPLTMQANRTIRHLPGCSLHQLQPNRGRASVRNWLVRHAQAPNLLFVDSDAEVTTPDFLLRYVPWFGKGSVVCGGIVHPTLLPSPKVSLRWCYEKAMESHFTARQRNKHPYANLRTFNFLIPMDVALRCPFDERITLYGYEDTLLGAHLQEQGVPVVHIDNPLMNADIEENARFLHKTEESMRCLYQMRTQMAEHSRLLQHHARLRRWGMDALLALIHPLWAPLMHRHLCGAHPTVWALQVYKLSYYCALCRTRRTSAPHR